jgi:membrane protein DedA with SNARE-associated domain
MVEGITDWVIALVRENVLWAVAVVFLLSFGESLAFVSLLLPATVILFALGALIGGADLPFWPLWLAAAVGATLGDWVSFWLGRRFGPAIAQVWPLSRHPDLLPRGHAFFEKWGIAGVFFGRFFGPLRAAVPLAAGICDMPHVKFQIANVASAFVWATGILAPGVLGMRWWNGSW